MAVKYTIPYKDDEDRECRVDIDLQSWTDPAIIIRSALAFSFNLSYENQSLNKYEPVVPSVGTMQLYSDDPNTPGPGLNIDELQTASDMDFLVQWYVENTLQWQGFLVPDGIQRQLESDPYIVEIKATDGLNLLRGIRFNYRNYSGGRAIINNMLDILQGDLAQGRTRSPLPVRWICTLTNPAYPGEDIINTDELSIDYRSIIDYDQLDETSPLLQQVKQYSYWLIENEMRAIGARLYQAGGRWVIERVNDVITGIYDWTEIDSSNTVTTGSVDVNKTINRGGDYAFINEDAIVMVEPGIKSVKVIYDQVMNPKGIVPNGDFELTTPQRDDISDPEANINDWIWLTKPGGAPYTLWWDRPDYTINAAQTDAGFYGNSVSSLGNAPQTPTDEGVSFLYNTANEGFAIPVDNRIWTQISIRFKYMLYFYDTSTGPLPEPLVRLFIWYIQNQFDVGDSLNYVWLTRYGYWKLFDPQDPPIAAKVGNPNDTEQLNEVVQINFKEEGGVSIPENLSEAFPASNIRDADNEIIRGRITGLVVGLDGGSDIHSTRFDDLEITVPNLNEIWEAENIDAGTNVTKIQEITQRISSAYTGFYWSNYTKNWSQTYNDFEFVDTLPDSSTISGPLSKILANAILRNNRLPSRVFQGSIIGQFQFGEIYEIQTLPGKYMALKAEYNSETNITNLTAIQVRNDPVPGVNHFHYTSESERSNNAS